jgi:two-component system, OmpR family, alkaline phosphatase synthesis response regulator PhoP
MPTVLVVEDDDAVRDIVKIALEQEGISVEEVEDGKGAIESFNSSRTFDLIILDLMLPDTSGISLCQQFRGISNVPIIMLTARDDETSVVVGLEVGADDYVTKPFSPRELVGRVRANLRRRQLDAQALEYKLEFPGLSIDLLRRQVLVGEEPVDLTAMEFEILKLLSSYPGRVYSRYEIMHQLWDSDFYGNIRTVDMHVLNLRKKIEVDPKSPRYVQTARGMGYRFAEL